MAGILETLGTFKQGIPSLASYAWVLWVFVPLALVIFSGVLWKLSQDKKKQWTHELIVERVLANGELTKPVTHRMKRFPLIKNAAVFELEYPFLGSYLMPELDSYTGTNQFSIILDTNNRIYIKTATRFDTDSRSKMVSAKHAGIDLAFEDLKSDWQHQYKTNKRVDWAEIAKFALWGLLIIAVMVISIKGIGQWGENHKIDAQKAQSEAKAYQSLADALETVEGTMNTQVLILDLLKQNYGTNNIQPIIREKLNVTN